MKEDQTIKADEGKPELSLVPTQVIKDIADVRMYGVKKYGDNESWRMVEKQRYIDALYRHLLDYIDNNKAVDEESGIPHIKHMACNIAFLSEMEAVNEQAKVVRSRSETQRTKGTTRTNRMRNLLSGFTNYRDAKRRRNFR